MQGEIQGVAKKRKKETQLLGMDLLGAVLPGAGLRSRFVRSRLWIQRTIILRSRSSSSAEKYSSRSLRILRASSSLM